MSRTGTLRLNVKEVRAALDKRRPGKYRARRSEYNGRWYASQREAQIAAQLDQMMKAGLVASWTPQPRFPLYACQLAESRLFPPGYMSPVSWEHVCGYVADFDVRFPDGRREVWECKGFWTPEAKLKWKWAHACYPDVCFVEKR